MPPMAAEVLVQGTTGQPIPSKVNPMNDDRTVSLSSSSASSTSSDPDSSPSSSLTVELQKEIDEVRSNFLAEVETNPDLYAEYDINKIKTSDWYVTRFLLRKHRDVGQASKMIIDCMRWRQEMSIPHMTDQTFPREFFQIGAVFAYETDHWGNRVIYLRVNVHKRIGELQEVIKKFVMHIMNSTDVAVDGRGMSILFDCSGAGIANADMDFLWFLISTLRNYYPEGLAYVLVYELPWILKSCWSMAKGWVPEDDRKLIKFAGRKDVTDYIPRDHLPDYMGGTCTRDYRAVPDGCPTAEEVAEQYGFRIKDLKKMRAQFEEHLKD